MLVGGWVAGMLESAEAARRLGVKLPTLYAYVSRGLLVSHPAPGGRRSLFASEDIEALAKRSRGRSGHRDQAGHGDHLHHPAA